MGLALDLPGDFAEHAKEGAAAPGGVVPIQRKIFPKSAQRRAQSGWQDNGTERNARRRSGHRALPRSGGTGKRPLRRWARFDGLRGIQPRRLSLR
jgi:hypothetical protein